MTLLDQIGEKTGVTADLKTCFPNHYKQILSIAYYLVLEDQNPLFRFKKWAAIHKHPYGKDIPCSILKASEIPVRHHQLPQFCEGIYPGDWKQKGSL